MGREVFRKLVDHLRRFKEEPSCRALNLFGSLGYGKSYIMAALACLLIKNGERVVFLPNCRALLNIGFGNYVTLALLLCFGDSLVEQREIYCCEGDPGRLIKLCNKLSIKGVKLYFVVDQYNAFDLAADNEDYIGNEQKVRAKDWLQQIAYVHHIVKSATANYKEPRYMAEKQKEEVVITVYGGLTEV